MQRVSGLTIVVWSVISLMAGCGDNTSIGGNSGTDAPPTGKPTGPGSGDPGGGNGSGEGGGNGSGGGSGDPGSGSGGPGACDAAWHDVQIGTDLDDQLWGMAIDDANNVYLTGYEHGLGYVTNIEPDGDSRGVITKLDPSGAVVWSTAIDSAATDTIEDVAIEPGSGRIFAVGRTSGSFPGFTNQGQFDELVVQLDPDGHVAQLLEQGDELPQHPSRLGLGVDHDLVIAGYNDTFVHNNAVEGFEDGFVQRFDLQSDTGSGVAFDQSFFQTVPSTVVNRVTAVAVERDGSGSVYVTGLRRVP